MEITLPISGLILIVLGVIGISLAFITAGFLFFRKNKADTSSNLIAALLLLSGFTLLNETLTTSGISNTFKSLYFIPLNFSLAIAPLFYLFVKSKFIRKISKFDYLHLLLPLIQFVVFLFIGFRSISYKSRLWNNETFRFFLDLETAIFILGMVLYSYLALSLLRKPSNHKYFWSKDIKSWLRRMAIVFIVIALLEMILVVGELIFENRFPSSFYIFRSFLFVSLIFWIVYNALNLLYPKSIFRSLPNKSAESLDRDESLQIKSRLETLMEKEKIFLNPDLSLNILSNYLGTSVKNCSRYFSSELNTNFNTYINQYRVDIFKEMLKSGKYEHLTLLGIAYESGFDSKSTFNRVFKKLEGMTPTMYKNSSADS